MHFGDEHDEFFRRNLRTIARRNFNHELVGYRAFALIYTRVSTWRVCFITNLDALGRNIKVDNLCFSFDNCGQCERTYLHLAHVVKTRNWRILLFVAFRQRRSYCWFVVSFYFQYWVKLLSLAALFSVNYLIISNSMRSAFAAKKLLVRFLNKNITAIWINNMQIKSCNDILKIT